MYHRIVKRILRNGFENVSKGNYEAVLSQCVPNVRHTFAGNHTFGGHRNDMETLRRWFHRLGRVLPGMTFEIHDIVVQGMPWDTAAVVRWTEQVTLANGVLYVNHGMHYLRLRWGRVVSFDVYLDTQETERVLTGLGAFGVEEAVAAPITS